MKTSNYPEIEYWARLLKEDGIVEGVHSREPNQPFDEIDERSMEENFNELLPHVLKIILHEAASATVESYDTDFGSRAQKAQTAATCTGVVINGYDLKINKMTFPDLKPPRFGLINGFRISGGSFRVKIQVKPDDGEVPTTKDFRFQFNDITIKKIKKSYVEHIGIDVDDSTKLSVDKNHKLKFENAYGKKIPFIELNSEDKFCLACHNEDTVIEVWVETLKDDLPRIFLPITNEPNRNGRLRTPNLPDRHMSKKYENNIRRHVNEDNNDTITAIFRTKPHIDDNSGRLSFSDTNEMVEFFESLGCTLSKEQMDALEGGKPVDIDLKDSIVQVGIHK